MRMVLKGQFKLIDNVIIFVWNKKKSVTNFVSMQVNRYDRCGLKVSLLSAVKNTLSSRHVWSFWEQQFKEKVVWFFEVQ